MRINVVGECDSAKSIAGLLTKANLVITEDFPEYTLYIEEAAVKAVVVDGIDCDLERTMLLMMEQAGVNKFVLRRAGGIRSDKEIRIMIPKDDVELKHAVEYGCVRGLLKEINSKVEMASLTAKQIKPIVDSISKVASVLLFLLFPVLAQAQQQFVIARYWDGTNIINAGDNVNNALRVNIVAGAAGGGTSSSFGAAFPATGTASGFFDGTNMQGSRVFDLDSGAGTQYAFGVNLRFTGAGGSTEAAADVGNNAFRVNCVTGCVAGGSFADASAFTFGTTAVSNTAFVVDDTATNVVAENSAGAARMNTNRILYSMNTNSTGTEVGTLANPFRIDPTGTTAQPASQSGTWNINNISGTVSLPTGAATEATLATRFADATFTGRFPAGSTPADNESNAVTFSRLGVFNYLFDGVTWDRSPGNSTDGTLVNLGANNDVTVTSGSITVSATDLDIRNLTAALDTVVANAGTGTFTVAGAKSDNGGVPSTTNLGTLPAVALAADPVRTEGNQVALRTQLDGDLAVTLIDELPAGTQNIGNVDVLTLPSVTIGTFPDNEPFNVAQFGGNAVVTGTGVGGLGIPRVTISNDSSLAANQSVNLNQVAGAGVAVGNGTAAGSLRVSVASDSTGTIIATQATAANLNVRPDTSGATAAAPPARANFVGGLTSGATGGFLQGITVCDSHTPIDIVTATTTLIVTGVSGRHVRICAWNFLTAGANNVAIITGTGATCGTSTAGVNGGITAAEGWNLPANGGIAQGSGFGEIARTETTGDSICIITSAAVQLSGNISYAIY